MRKTFAPLDDVLIERLFQPAAELVMHRMGFGRGAVICLFLDLAALAWIASRVRGLSDAVVAWNGVAACLDVCLLLLGLVALISLRTLFRRVERRPANPLRLTMLPHRATALLMLAARLMELQAPCLADAADIAMLVFATSALYLGACAARPLLRRGVPASSPPGNMIASASLGND